MTPEHKPQIVLPDGLPRETRIVVIHDNGDSAVYDVREIRISPEVILTIEYGQLVIRPGEDA